MVGTYVAANIFVHQSWPVGSRKGNIPAMLVITFANQKGGSGKTTMAANVAAALHRDGHRVVILDVDPQGSAVAWSSRAAELEYEGPTCFAVGASALRRDLARLGEMYDVAIIDGPAKLGAEARAAMVVADLVAVPIVPGAVDLWAAHETVRVIEEARALRPDLRAVSFLNRADRTTLTTMAEKALETLGVEPLGVVVRSRVAFGEAMLEGRGVVDTAPKSEAAVEIRRLTRALLAAVSGGKKNGAVAA